MVDPSHLRTRLLLERVRGGEREAVGALYDLHVERVYAYLRSIGSGADAEDLTHEVFEALLRAAGQGRLPRPDAFRAWLFTVARNLALDHRRKHGRVDVVAPAELARRLSRRDGQSEALRAIFDPDLARAIRRLPSLPREVVLLRYVADLDLAGIAAVIGTSEDSVKQAHRRALAALRDRAARGDGRRRRPLAMSRLEGRDRAPRRRCWNRAAR